MIQKFLLSVGFWIALTVTVLADSQYCIVKVGDLGKNLLIGRDFHRIPGLAPIFTPLEGPRYTLSDRRLTPYNEPYPTSYLDQNPDSRSSFAFDDHWKAEPWSGRIVASAHATKVVALLQPGAHSFQTIGEPSYSYSPPFLLSESHETIVIRGGRALVVGKSALEPWKPAEALVKAGADGIAGVYEAPSIHAIIVVDTAHRLWGSPDGINWQKLASLDKDAFGKVFDSPEANSALFVSLKSVTKISNAENGGELVTETLSSTNANGADRDFAYLPQFGQVLKYGRGSVGEFLRRPGLSLPKASWRKLAPRGFDPITGGDDVGAAPQGAVGWRVKALKSVGIALIDGRRGLFSYDGKEIVAIKGGERAKIGRYPMFFDLPAIKRTLINTEHGLKMLSDKELIDAPIEFPSPALMVSDWPEAERSVIFSADKIAIVDGELRVRETLDINEIGFNSSVSGGSNPETGDLIFTGKRGTYLIVDTKRSGSDACLPKGN